MEQLGELFWQQAHAGVADGDRQLLFAAHHVDRDRTALAVVLDRVAQQVEQHLAQTGAVGENAELRASVAASQADLPAGGQRRDQRQAFGQQRADRDRLAHQVELASLNARQIEHVVDHRQQVLAGVGDVAQLPRRDG